MAMRGSSRSSTTTVAPGATLAVPDDRLPTGSVALFRLEPDSGLWGDTGIAAVADPVARKQQRRKRPRPDSAAIPLRAVPT
jgi:hypothetical protein